MKAQLDPLLRWAFSPAALAPPRRPVSTWRVPLLLWLLGAILLLTAVFRLVTLAQAVAAGGASEAYDGAHYLDHLLVTTMHIGPGIAFLGLGPLQFSTGFRRRWPAWHRRGGRIFVVSGLATGVAGLWMNQHFPPVGGVLKYVSAHVFGVSMIVAILVGLAAIFRRDVVRH